MYIISIWEYICELLSGYIKIIMSTNDSNLYLLGENVIHALHEMFNKHCLASLSSPGVSHGNAIPQS